MSSNTHRRGISRTTWNNSKEARRLNKYNPTPLPLWVKIATVIGLMIAIILVNL